LTSQTATRSKWSRVVIGLRGQTECILVRAVDIEIGVSFCSLRNHTLTEPGHCREPTKKVYFWF